MNIDQALDLLRALEHEDVRYVLIGSIAMAAQGIVRATQDIDLFISPDTENVARLKRSLQSLFDDPSIEEIDAADLAGSYPVIRYGPPDADFVIDFVARIGDMFTFSDIESERIVIESVGIRVATPKMLYRMKRDTVRPQDKIDAEQLRTTFNLPEGD